LIKKVITITIILIIATIANTFANFDFNENCQKAHSSILSLKFDKAQQYINIEKNINPKNKIPFYLESLKDFIKIIINQDKKEFNELIEKRRYYIDIIEKDEIESPYYRYCLAEIYFQWAVARLIFVKDILNFTEGLKAALEIKKSYSLIDKNNEIFPNFYPNLKLLGLMHAMQDAVPESYRKIVQSFTFSGSFEKGISELNLLLDKSLKDKNIEFIYPEVIFLITFIEINLQSDKQRVNYLKKYFENTNLFPEKTNNIVLIYSKVRYLIYTGQTDSAINIIEKYNKENNWAYIPFMDYLLGKLKLQRLDKDAVLPFYNYLLKYKGLHYIKSTYQLISWYYLVNNNKSKYNENQNNIIKYGITLSETDKQAEREAKKNEIPNLHLLKARLLSDGAYFSKAIEEITNKDTDLNLRNSKDSIEYLYRLARIYHEWGKIELAIPYYETVIKNGEQKPWYFAANSALLLGVIYENMNKKNIARLYFQKCLLIEPQEYKGSIHAKAKSGLKRL